MTAFQRTNIRFHPHVRASVYCGWLSTGTVRKQPHTHTHTNTCRKRPVQSRYPGAEVRYSQWTCASLLQGLWLWMKAWQPACHSSVKAFSQVEVARKNREIVECVVAFCPVVHSCLTHPSQLKAGLDLLRDCFDSRLSGGSRRLGETQMPPFSLQLP